MAPCKGLEWALFSREEGRRQSGGSQFFIRVADRDHLNGEYTAFSEVVEGMGVADKIVVQPRDSKGLPNERIEMTVKVQKQTFLTETPRAIQHRVFVNRE